MQACWESEQILRHQVFIIIFLSRPHRMHQLYLGSPRSVWITCKPLLFSATRTVQGTLNCYVGSVQATEVNVPTGHLALPRGYLGPFSNDAGAVVTSASSLGSLATADTLAFPSGISQVLPNPIQFTNTTALGAPQVTSQPYRRPCEWKDNTRRICGKDCCLVVLLTLHEGISLTVPFDYFLLLILSNELFLLHCICLLMNSTDPLTLTITHPRTNRSHVGRFRLKYWVLVRQTSSGTLRSFFCFHFTIALVPVDRFI
ncbi:hypothetical protein BKA82DRAFT_2598615 [Pisolithus tinctorius]|nr:hypothetical protein BKA82DRAFT_2598615 [Pisolithus tinctorius]